MAIPDVNEAGGLLERDADAPAEDGIPGILGMDAEDVPGAEVPAPPPAFEANCANPTDMGFWRNTE